MLGGCKGEMNEMSGGVEKFGNGQDVEWRGQLCCDYRAREVVAEIGKDFPEYSTPKMLLSQDDWW